MMTQQLPDAPKKRNPHTAVVTVDTLEGARVGLAEAESDSDDDTTPRHMYPHLGGIETSILLTSHGPHNLEQYHDAQLDAVIISTCENSVHGKEPARGIVAQNARKRKVLDALADGAVTAGITGAPEPGKKLRLTHV